MLTSLKCSVLWSFYLFLLGCSSLSKEAFSKKLQLFLLILAQECYPHSFSVCTASKDSTQDSILKISTFFNDPETCKIKIYLSHLMWIKSRSVWLHVEEHGWIYKRLTLLHLDSHSPNNIIILTQIPFKRAYIILEPSLTEIKLHTCKQVQQTSSYIHKDP